MLNKVTKLIMLICLPFLLIGSPSQFDFRLLPFLWDFGHVMLFASITWIVLVNRSRYLGMPEYRLLPIVILIVIGVSIAIELLQQSIGREGSVLDVLRNCLGATLAVVFRPAPGPVGKPWFRSIFRLMAILCLMILLYPLGVNTVDAIFAYRGLPVLADFETPFQLVRWEGYRVESKNFGPHNNHVMQVKFPAAEFSSVKLKVLPANWTAYTQLKFRIYNLSSSDQTLHFRINDRFHAASNWDYHDRYNRILSLQPGWNQIILSLEEVRVQPKNGVIDMTNIDKISFFTYRTTEDFTYYFDDILLDRDDS